MMEISLRHCLFFITVLWISTPLLDATNLDCEVSCRPRWAFPEPSIRKITRMLGESVSFRCNAQGKPRPEISWQRDGHKITSKNKKVRLNGYVIVLKDLMLKDSGVYRCVVENAYGQISWDYHLIVYETYTRSQRDETGSPNNVTITEGETAIFRCDILGEQEATTTVQWVKERTMDSKTGQDSNNRQNRLELKHEVNDGSNDLKLVAVNVADSGQYTCIIKTPLTTIERSAWLKVLPPKAEHISGPRVSSVFDDVGSREKNNKGGLITYLKGVGISLGAMAGLLGLGFIIVCTASIYRAVCKLDQRQERP